MYARFRFGLLFLAAALALAAGTTLAVEPPVAPTAAQAASGVLPPQTVGDDSAGYSIHLLRENPLTHAGSRVVVVGTVVRASRQLAGGVTHSSFLLRDARGDTISIIEPLEVPPVGVRVRVAGSVDILPTGTPVIGQDTQQPLVSVLERPDVVIGTQPVVDPVFPARTAGSCLNASGGRLGRALCSVGTARWTLPAAGLVVLLGVAGGILWRRQSRPQDPGSIPLIVDLQAIRAVREPAAAPEQPLWQESPPPLQKAAPPPRSVAASPGNGAFMAFDDNAPQAHSTGRLNLAKLIGSNKAAASAELTAGAANDSVLQLLPGRLEVLQGEGLEPEIRFFRMSSQEVPEITFGRSDGPPYRHVKLEEPTVSRLHARLRFADRNWKITSLSSINPVVVNGHEMAAQDVEHALTDGDRIEIGTIVLRYRDTA